jgi:AcrR family transcriptional regulator
VAEGGVEAASTRAVASAAGVQAPTLYRLFGDKQGLLDAVAEHGFATYLVSKQAQLVTDDPIADLARGWDLHVAFGVENPGLYVLMYGGGRRQPAEGRRLLAAMLDRAAAAGRLRVPVGTATELVSAASVGITLRLIADPDPELSARVRDRVLASISTDAPAGDGDGAGAGVAAHAVALRAVLADHPELLGSAETGLMLAWLDRVAS